MSLRLSKYSRGFAKTDARLISVLALLVFLTGCGKSKEAARLELAQMNIPYTERAFIKKATQGDTGAVSLFLAAGMDIEAKSSEGQTALLLATLSGHVNTVKALIASGADANAKDKFSGTALMTAAWKGYYEIAQALLAKGAE